MIKVDAYDVRLAFGSAEIFVGIKGSVGRSFFCWFFAFFFCLRFVDFVSILYNLFLLFGFDFSVSFLVVLIKG